MHDIFGFGILYTQYSVYLTVKQMKVFFARNEHLLAIDSFSLN